MVLIVFVMLCFVGLTGFVAFLIAGPDRIWRIVVGQPDLGPVELATLDRRSASNSFLACPPNMCGVAADRPAPVYRAAPAEVVDAAAAVLDRFPRSIRVDDRADPARARFVIRSRVMRFPDTVWLEAMPTGDGETALAVYSRSQIGMLDFGVNRERVTRLIERLDQSMANSGAASARAD